MIFSGLSALQLAGIFGIAGAGVVLLYLLKLRRRVVSVPFSPLWERILRDKEAITLFSRLKRLISMLLQLALLALLVLALGDPRPVESLLRGRTLVILLDASASMQATDVGPNRLEVAKERVRSLIRGLGGADRMLIAQMDASVTPLGPLTGDTAALERELESVRATDERADFARALRFATDALRGVPSGEVVVVSDGALGPAADASGAVHVGDVKISFERIGARGRNVGVTEFAVRRYPIDRNRYEVMLEVTNSGASEEDVELQLLGDGQVVDLATLRLKPGEKLPRFYPQLSGASRTLEARLSLAGGRHDDLAVDDRAYALLPERRRTRVLVVTEGNTYLDAALLLDEYLDVTEVRPQDYPALSDAGQTFDAMIFDGVTPAQPPKASALYLDPRGPGSPVKVDRALKAPGFDKVSRKHPAVRFLALDDVNVSAGHKLIAQPGDDVVGAAEGGASPILVAGARASFRFVALGFDVRDSDLPLRPAWPLFVLDCINWFADDDARAISSFRTGEVIRLPVPAGASRAFAKLPSGDSRAVPVHEGRAVFVAERAGFYVLSASSVAADGVGTPSARVDDTAAFTANLLDESESAIAPRESLVIDGRPAGALVGFRAGLRREIWIYLLLAAALLTAVEWATYHRRITV